MSKKNKRKNKYYYKNKNYYDDNQTNEHNFYDDFQNVDNKKYSNSDYDYYDNSYKSYKNDKFVDSQNNKNFYDNQYNKNKNHKNTAKNLNQRIFNQSQYSNEYNGNNNFKDFENGYERNDFQYKKFNKKHKVKDFYNDEYDNNHNYYERSNFYNNQYEVDDFQYEKNFKKSYKNHKNKYFNNDQYEYSDFYNSEHFIDQYEVDDFQYEKNFKKSHSKKSNKKHKVKDFYNDDEYNDLYREDFYQNSQSNFWKPKYSENEIEINDYDNDFYDEKNNNKSKDSENHFDDDNESTGKKKKKFGFNGNKKKKTIFAIFISTIAVSFVIVVIVLLVFFLMNRNAPAVSSPRESISKEYMIDKTLTSKNAMNYISERTLSLQFLYSDNNGKGKVINGTGWIFNKNKNEDIYYIATNVHVAAALNYGGKKITENGETEDFTNFILKNVSLGYVDTKNSTDFYDIKNLNMVNYVTIPVPDSDSESVSTPNPDSESATTLDPNPDSELESTTTPNLEVAVPEIAYLPDASDANSSFYYYNNFYSAYGEKFQPVIDFAVLKFDFTSLKSSDSNFASWLSIYDSNPTQLSSEPIKLDNKTQFYSYVENTIFYMGGFPYLENTEVADNKGQAEWIGFSKFKTAINTNKNNDVITENNYYTLASGAVQNSPADDKKEILENNKIEFFQENNTINYLNVGFYWLLAAKSAGGASGSMLIKEISGETNKFEVVGIYWGTQNIRLDSPLEGFLTEAIAGVPAVGVANMLNYNYYSSKNNTTYSGIDIFHDATEKIKNDNNNPVELLYNYSSNNPNVTAKTNLNVKKIAVNFFSYSFNLENSWNEIKYKKIKKI